MMMSRQEEYATSFGRSADGDLDVTPLITNAVGLGATAWAFECLPQADEVKVLITPSSP
jgi:hypothetical protein